MRNARTLSIPIAMILAGVTGAGQSVPPVQSSGYDISGAWFNVYQGADGNATIPLVAYGGYPLNEAGRLYALTWSPSRMTLRQQQCAQYSPHFLLHGGGNYRFWEDRDPFTQKLIAIRMYGQITEGTRTVWMDGRPHPPAYAPHTFLGFSTGKYEGNALTVYTTHMKRNWIKANGMTQSDQATLVEHFIRHGDRITYVTVLTDPVYLSEPLIRTSDLGRSLRNPDAWLYACDDGEQLVGRPKDQIPNYLYGKNPYLHEASDKYHIPLLADLGGPETAYPDFLAKIKDPAATDAAANAALFPSAVPPHTSKAVDPTPHDGEIHAFPVQGNIYLLAGEDANIAVQVGEQGALVVDTGSGKLADKVIAAVKKLIGDKPIQFIVNTSFHSDHTGGNVKVHAAGSDPSLVGSFFSIGGQSFADAGVGSTVIAHQNVQTRMSAPVGKVSLTPPDSWPSDTFLEGRRRKYYNDEAVEVLWQPNASTDGDTIVHFRRSDVIVTGDIFTTTRYPFIDIANGGSVQGFMDALNNILDRTVYKHEGEGGTMIVPGHGRICDEYEVSEYRDMLGIIRDRVQAMIDSGATVQQVKSARLTADYDDRYGANTGAWTTDMFVESVYASLKQGRPKARASK